MIHDVQQSLFTHGTKYPSAPGWKDRDTSKAAADEIAPSVSHLRHLVLKALAVRPMSSDQVAEYLDIDRLSIRPRLTEASKLGLVIDSGKRAINASGKKAVIWRLK